MTKQVLPRNYTARPSLPPRTKRRFCWYRRGLLRTCGEATLHENGLCSKHSATLDREVERLAKLVNKGKW
jgi:hypothetical protein